MKQSKLTPSKLMTHLPNSEQEIAREFARIGALARSDKRDEAALAAAALHRKHPNNAIANFAMAIVLVESEPNADALPYAKAAVRFAPKNAGYMVFLGKLYVDLGLIEFAPRILEKAFDLNKNLFQAPWALAHYYFHSGQGDRALPYYGQALRAAPAAFHITIKMERSECLRSLGRAKEAEPDLTSAMAVPELRVRALTGLAMLQRNDHTSSYAEKIRKELELPDLTNKDRSALLLSLGRLHENGHDYDNAFANFERSRNLLSPAHHSSIASELDDALNVLTKDVFEKFRGFGNASEKPIFVVGMPRSGTTMTEQIIASHSRAEGVGELRRIHDLVMSVSGSGSMREVLKGMAKLGPSRWNDVPQRYLELLNVLAPDARHAVDKMPHNFKYIGFIRFCFPKAKIIHCRRNPLDNFISAFQNSFDVFHSYSFDQVTYGKYYIDYSRLMDHWNAVLPGNIYESRYETLTANPEAEIRKMLEFLDLPWEVACLNFHERESTVKTFSRQQVRNPINTGSVGRWRNYEKHLGPIMDVLASGGVQV